MSISQTIVVAAYLTLPLVVGGILHMITVKTDLLAFAKIPVNATAFGANKTWRGFLVMSFGTAFATFVIGRLETTPLAVFAGPQGIPLGFLLGFAYALFELPNSYLKRRMGIQPGELPREKRWLFFALDHTDSLLGCTLVYFLWRPDLLPSIVGFFFLGPTIHTLVNLVLYALRIRKQPF